MTPENLLRAARYWLLVERIARMFGVAPLDVLAATHAHHVTRARHELWWVLTETFGESKSRAGKLTGHDRSTVVKALRARSEANQALGRSEAAE